MNVFLQQRIKNDVASSQMRSAARLAVFVESVHTWLARVCERKSTEKKRYTVCVCEVAYINPRIPYIFLLPHRHPFGPSENAPSHLMASPASRAAQLKTASSLNMTSFCRASLVSKRAIIPCDDEPI